MTLQELIDLYFDVGDLHDVYEGSRNAAGAAIARSDLENACQQYDQDPTAANRAAVQDAVNDLQDRMAGIVPMPPYILGLGGGDLVGALRDVYSPTPMSEAMANALDNTYPRPGGSWLDPVACDAFDNAVEMAFSHPYTLTDPLMFDLNGDDIIETLGTDRRIFFDRDGDGIAHTTGWVGRNDGFLVRDVNANGSIDNGSELFGTDTLLSNSSLATDGIEALADLDSNTDGVIDSNDTAFSELKIWKDIDSDGISRSDELLTLAQAGIASISLTRGQTTLDLGNGNTASDTGAFNKIGGGTGLFVNAILAERPVFSRYLEPVEVSTAASLLPTIWGFGLVRDLNQAATLSSSLLDTLTDYVEATTLEDRAELLPTILEEWAATAERPSSWGADYELEGIQTYIDDDPNEGYTPEYVAALEMVHQVEAFDGRPVASGGFVTGAQVSWLTQAYATLKQVVYSAIQPQLGAKQYYDALEYDNSQTLSRIDWSGVQDLIDDNLGVDYASTVEDLATLARVSGRQWSLVGFDPWAKLSDTLTTSGVPVALDGLLADHMVIGTSDADYLSVCGLLPVLGLGGDDFIILAGGNGTTYGGSGNDTIIDVDGADTIDGGGGDDEITDTGVGDNILRGGDGDDTIAFTNQGNNTVVGGAGADLISIYNPYPDNSAQTNYLMGGTGNDQLISGGSSDTYYFDRGDGQDTIRDADSWLANNPDALVFGEGIEQSDLSFSVSGNSLVIAISDPNNPSADDQITIQYWFGDDSYRIESFRFADDSVLTKAEVHELALTVTGTSGDDVLTGSSYGDSIFGLGGDDTITDTDGSDLIEGGDGADVITDTDGYTVGETNILRGGGGDDTIHFSLLSSNVVEGGDGDDLLDGDISSSGWEQANTLRGGAGNDRIVSGGNADTYLFDRGDGQDSVLDLDGWDQRETDTLAFGEDATSGNEINHDQLWFRHVGGDLEVSVIGTADSVVVEDWYSGQYWEVEEFTSSDGKTLTHDHVDNLVSAMASLSPPSFGQTTLPTAYQTALGSVLAANWT